MEHTIAANTLLPFPDHNLCDRALLGLLEVLLHPASRLRHVVDPRRYVHGGWHVHVRALL